MKDFKQVNIKKAIEHIFREHQLLELQRIKDDSEFGFLAALERIIFILEGKPEAEIENHEEGKK